MVEPISKEEGARIIRAGFAHVLLDVSFDCSAPIYWFRMTGEQRGPVLNNGTIFFVDAGAGPFGVTARHVLEGYRNAIRAEPRTPCEIGGVPFDLPGSLIAEDLNADIVTLRIDEETLSKIGRAPHVNPRAWPPAPPQIGKGVFFGGYPGRHRIEGRGIIQWGFAGGLDVATSVHENHISLRFVREDWVSAEGLEPPAIGEPWGGVSGAPLFAVVQNGVISWRLAGVVTEFGSTFEMVYASSLSRVRSDGSILL
jgi:hypothetical protein